MKCPPRCRSSWRLLTGRTEPNWQLRRPAQHERAAADAPATASFQCESQKGHAHSADGRLTVGEARQREPAGLDGQTQQSRLRIMARHISPAVNSASRSQLSAAESKEQPCDIATLARSQTSGLDTFAGLGEAMKLRQSREPMPLSVWIVFAVLASGSIAYLLGIVIFEDLFALFSEK